VTTESEKHAIPRPIRTSGALLPKRPHSGGSNSLSLTLNQNPDGEHDAEDGDRLSSSQIIAKVTTHDRSEQGSNLSPPANDPISSQPTVIQTSLQNSSKLTLKSATINPSLTTVNSLSPASFT
jgi:hypothetical protein